MTIATQLLAQLLKIPSANTRVRDHSRRVDQRPLVPGASPIPGGGV